MPGILRALWLTIMFQQSQLTTTVTEVAANATIAFQYHLRFRSFEEWKDFNIAWYEASGSSINFHDNVDHALGDVVQSFPVDSVNSTVSDGACGSSTYPILPLTGLQIILRMSSCDSL